MNFCDSTRTVLSLWMYTVFAFEGNTNNILALGWNIRCLHQFLVIASSLSPQTEVLSPYSVLVPLCRLFTLLIFCVVLTLRLPDFQALLGVLVPRQTF